MKKPSIAVMIAHADKGKDEEMSESPSDESAELDDLTDELLEAIHDNDRESVKHALRALFEECQAHCSNMSDDS